MRTTVFMSVVALAVCPALGASWDFDDWSTQGWTLGGNGAAGVGGNPVGSLAEPADNSGALYLPDGGFASMPVASTNSFVFSAEIAATAMAVNRFQAAGMGYRATNNQDTTTANTLAPPDAVTAWFEGKSSSSERMIFKDSYGGNTEDAMTWLKNSSGGVNPVESARATIYYNWEDGAGPGEAGKVVITWEELDYLPNAGNHPPLYEYQSGLDINDATGDYHEVNMIRLGGAYSWSQFYADNVSFIVPEPASLALLGLGGMALLRRRR